MGSFVLAHIEEKPVLQDLINIMIEKNITFTISSNPHHLVTKAESWYPDEKAGPSGQGTPPPKVVEPQQKPQEEPQQPQLLQQLQQRQQQQPQILESQETSSFADPFPPKPKRGRPPMKRKRESADQNLNAADLLGDDVAQPSFANLPPLAEGARVVRLVRSSVPSSIDLMNSPTSGIHREEVIKNLHITEAVDWVARTDADLASIMMKEGYIPAENHCHKCGHPMDHRNNRLEWRCMQVFCRGSSSMLLKNTWFSHFSLPLKKILKTIILWAQQLTPDEIRLLLQIPLKSVWLIENKIRETCIRIVDSYEPLGGEGVEVELGLQLVETRRLSATGRGGTINRQILAGIEPATGRCFLHIVTARKPGLYCAVAHWVRPGSTINGKKYENLPSLDEVANGNLWKMAAERTHVAELFNRLKPTNIGEMIGETFPGYLAELVVRFNEEENTLRKLFQWLRYDQLPGAESLQVKEEAAEEFPSGDRPISEEERPLFSETTVKEEDMSM